MAVAIIGAGVAGLTLADKLTSSGIPVVLVERSAVVGGLARSFHYDNGAVFDVGPHRFHTDDPAVQHYVEGVLDEDNIMIERNSQLYLFGKFLPWPISIKSLFSLPPHMFFNAGLDVLFPRKAKNESFEDYIIEHYGRTLYKRFFQPYTEKFLDYPCNNLHRDWATTGLNRATIDKKVDSSSLMALAKSVLLKQPVDTKFIYPKSGGIGRFAEKQARRVQAQGGRILLNEEVAEMRSDNGIVRGITTTSGEQIDVEHVFWSGSLDSLRQLGRPPQSLPRLHYMSTLLFNYLISHVTDHSFQWCYFGEKQIEVDRVCLMRNFNPRLVPEGKEAVCVEISCWEGSDFLREPARLDSVVESFLLRAGLLNSLDCVEDCHLERITETYPLYVLNYPRKLNSVFHWISGAWRNLTLIGRTGRFWYNNMDHSIAASLQIAEKFAPHYEKGILESGSEYSVENRHLQSV